MSVALLLVLFLIPIVALADDHSGRYTGSGSLCEPLNGGTCVTIQGDITVGSDGLFDAHGLSGSVDPSGNVTGSYDDGSGNIFRVTGSVTGGVMSLRAQKGSAYAYWNLTRSLLPDFLRGMAIIVGILVVGLVVAWIINANGTRPLASRILRGRRVDFERKHPAQYSNPNLKDDGASAYANIDRAKKNQPVKRSKYADAASHGPGGSTRLCKDMLKGMLALSELFQFRVSEIAGGVHAVKSAHYRGAAFDVITIDGKSVSDPQCHWQQFVEAAQKLEPTPDLILHPGNEPKHHSGHVHLQWACGHPRAAS